MFVLPTFGLGVIASPPVPPGTFDTATLENGQTNLDNTNVLTFTVQPSRDISAGDSITLAGLTGSQTGDGSLTLSGAGASVFGSAGSWTQSTGTLVLTVDTGQTLSTGSDTVITFNLTNPATVSSGVSGVTLDGENFIQASISGTFLNTVDTFNVTTRNTEANILSNPPTNPSGEVNIAFGTDTRDFYIYDGSAWYIYNTDSFVNNYSVNLDGTNDYIDCGGASDFGFTNGAGNDSAFSISAWVKLDSASIQRVVDKSGTTQASRSYLFGTDGDSKLSIFLGPGTGNYLYIRENTELSTGTWHHLVATYDGSNTGGGLTLYRAGAAITSSNLSSGSYAGLPSTSETLKIGRLNLNGSVMNGLVDEVAVFDYELTSSQVSTIYNSGSPADISSLNPLGWWRMGDDDSGTGTTITDQGSGGNNGTLTNGPTFSTTVPS